MCFIKRDSVFVASRAYKYLSCHRFINFKSGKNNDESLVINVTNHNGDITFIITDLNEKESFTLINPETGEYIYSLKRVHHYSIVINARKAIGKYSIYRKVNK